MFGYTRKYIMKCRDCDKTETVSGAEKGRMHGVRCASCGGRLDTVKPVKSKKKRTSKTEPKTWQECLRQMR